MDLNFSKELNEKEMKKVIGGANKVVINPIVIGPIGGKFPTIKHPDRTGVDNWVKWPQNVGKL
ncbi:bacteriocin [Enterococcus quebecensis]|uniref:Bacteriocin n=1 Tax=Enterococcus quebecensis TaxID=903983 RepID=A0A1E5GTD3_9ENTE|nr:bacteriocin [Enterococcus quebecensis]OEG15946.1 hypothetical protein BCR23_07300 [Enterococcus quebecensis]OJG74918.1 hypothetical protein RV12_GL001963 [Enterococcus quebecensis]